MTDERMTLLGEVLRGVPHVLRGRADVAIRAVTADSKRVEPGTFFVAIRGERFDGHDYLDEVIRRGAAAVLVERESIRLPVPVVVVKDSRRALAHVAVRWFGFPADRLTCVGITGTNGKTTTAFLVQRMLETAGCQSALLGTIGYWVGDRFRPATNTTPGPLELQGLLAEAVDRQLTHCVMEVSSHSLSQDRVTGIPFRVAVFMNLSQDHLDYHRTMEQYFQAKARLFERLGPDVHAVINQDDAWGRRLLRRTTARVLTFGEQASAMIRPLDVRLSWEGIWARLATPAGPLEIHSALLGRHNVANILATVGVGCALGLEPAILQRGIAALRAVPGRLERLTDPQRDAGQVEVIVDYAHTEEALRQVLTVVRELTDERRIVVFGCGGDRDPGKRPKMGRVASELADEVIITTDNPRSEDPAAIARAVMAGVKRGCHHAKVVLDRREAIEMAIHAAVTQGGVVVLAGKGHETCQIMKDTTIPFDDREEARRCLQSSKLSSALPAR